MSKYVVHAIGGCYSILQNLLEECPCFRESLLGKGELIALCDDNSNLWGEIRYGHRIIPPSDLRNIEFDKIIVCNIVNALDIKNKLITQYKIPESKIDMSCQELIEFTRKQTIYDFSKIVYHEKIQGSVAECGVYRGDFASYINKCFPDRYIWLFDTFSGFDKRDVDVDVQNNFSEEGADIFIRDTNIDTVISKMLHPELAVFKKGYFPNTTVGDNRLEKENFVFVHIDFDLYQPILAGLEYFYPKMVKGGVIHVHDFFTPQFTGASKAVEEFCEKENIRYTSIGDGYSISIIK